MFKISLFSLEIDINLYQSKNACKKIEKSVIFGFILEIVYKLMHKSYKSAK